MTSGSGAEVPGLLPANVLGLLVPFFEWEAQQKSSCELFLRSHGTTKTLKSSQVSLRCKALAIHSSGLHCPSSGLAKSRPSRVALAPPDLASALAQRRAVRQRPPEKIPRMGVWGLGFRVWGLGFRDYIGFGV